MIVAVYGLKPLQFLGFCDTILILRKRVPRNKQANINIFANVFACKITPKIRSHISEFTEWEYLALFSVP